MIATGALCIALARFGVDVDRPFVQAAYLFLDMVQWSIASYAGIFVMMVASLTPGIIVGTCVGFVSFVMLVAQHVHTKQE